MRYWVCYYGRMPASSDSKITEEVLAAEKRIEAVERRILKEESAILTADQHIMDAVEEGQKNSRFAQSLYRYRFLISLVVMVAVILVWQGVGELSKNLPVVSTAIGAILVGLALLWAINYFTTRKS